MQSYRLLSQIMILTSYRGGVFFFFLLKSIQFLVSGSHSIKPRDELIMDKETHTCGELQADPLTPSSQQGNPCSRWNHPAGGMKLQHSFLHHLWWGEMVWSRMSSSHHTHKVGLQRILQSCNSRSSSLAFIYPPCYSNRKERIKNGCC